MSWKAPANSSSLDWIGLFPVGTSNYEYVWWNYTGGATSGSFAAAAPYGGMSYEFRYLLNDSYTDAQRSNIVSVTALNYALERLDAFNRTGEDGEDLLSGNYNWALPLLNLPGRSGLDVNVSLAYNSLIWTKTGSYIGFDADIGTPSPGFRLGFPVIEQIYSRPSGVTAIPFYLMILPSGQHVELRNVANGGQTSNVYESVDSSRLRLKVDPFNDKMTLYTPEGSKLLFEYKGGSNYVCTKITDRNGNYITVTYNTVGAMTKITDTLSRDVNFNYDSYNHLTSITQSWNGTNHVWATFSWTNVLISTNFPGLTVSGPQNGSTIPVVRQVSLADGSYYRFSYTRWGQVNKIEHIAGLTILSTRTYNLPPTQATAQSDCPRFTQRLDDVWNWTYAYRYYTLNQNAGTNQIAGQVKLPDGTVVKETFATNNWQRGLLLKSEIKETEADTTAKKRTELNWTQDDTNLSYPLNPRVIESNLYDDVNNRRRTTVSYTATSTYSQPEYIKEYDASASTVLRMTRLSYVTTNYIQTSFTSSEDRWIVGLVNESSLYEGEQALDSKLQSKVKYYYDDLGTNSEQLVDQTPVVWHNTNYGAAFRWRGNLTRIERWDVTAPSDSTKAVTTRIGYNTAGSTIFTRNPVGSQVDISYADNFSDGANHNTLAYPTKVASPDGPAATRLSDNRYYAATKYDYATGVVKRTETPKRPQDSAPAATTYIYDTAGRLTQTTNAVTSAYTTFVYDPELTSLSTHATIADGQGEFVSTNFLDGYGQTWATVKDHPVNGGNSLSLQFTTYDNMGRVVEVSNPTQVDSGWHPTGDDSVFYYVTQAYDWNGRPTFFYNQDHTAQDPSDREISYAGCGCAGGNVTTIKSEIVSGQNRRTQKIWQDVLGRTVKSQDLYYDGTTPYRTTLTEYNGRDQATVIKTFKGDANVGDICSTNSQTGICQQTELVYDGHGRLQKRYLPSYQESNVSPPYNGNVSARGATRQYYGDDRVYIETDPRGATATYTYNNRGLVSGVSYYSPNPSLIPNKPSVAFSYDELGRRSYMSDGAGNVTYNNNSLGQTMSEERVFTMPGAPSGTFTASYDYTIGGKLKYVRDPFGDQINYGYDKAGRVTSVMGSAAFAGVTDYLGITLQYRAWGGPKGYGYDQRLRITSAYGGKSQITYTYNKSSDLTYAEMTSGMPYHQTFGKDHVGRFTGVSTPEITVPNDYVLKQSSPPDGLPPNYKVRPFTTSVSYDEFDNATSTTNNYWHQITSNLNYSLQSFQTTYVNGRVKKDGVAGKVFNNRDETWYYNEMGQVKADTRTTQTFDVAGQTTQTLDANNAQIYVNYSYDGDGLQAKFDQKRDDGTTDVRYRIYSSVLGGLLTDISSAGQKVETRVYRFVYGQDSVRQVKAYSVPNGGNPPLNVPDTVVFEGSDPHGTKATVWDRNTNAYKYLSLAAPGAYVEDINWERLKNSFVSTITNQYSYGQQSASQYLGSYFSMVDPKNPGTGCSLDGQKVTCQSLFKSINSDSVDLESLRISTTGIGGGDSGVIVGTLSNIRGSIAANKKQACTNSCALGPDGEPVTPGEVYPTNAFLGMVTGFGLTGGQQDGGKKNVEPPSTLRRPYPCFTVDNLLKQDDLQVAMNTAWDRAKKANEEFGGWVVWDQSKWEAHVYLSNLPGITPEIPGPIHKYWRSEAAWELYAGNNPNLSPIIEFHTHLLRTPGSPFDKSSLYYENKLFGIAIQGIDKYSVYDRYDFHEEADPEELKKTCLPIH